MHTLTNLAGRVMSPQGEAVFLLLWGLGAGLMGGFLALRSGAEAMAAYGDQTQQDVHDAYGRGVPPDATTRERRRTIARRVGWVLAVVGPACAITGIVQLAQQ